MEKELFIKNSISIKASPVKVWNALVNPDETKKYMFGCEALSDWKVGSPLIWKGSYEGKEMIFVKGSILAIQPEKLLAYTVIDPNSAIPDVPENYLTVTYTLAQENGETMLYVSQGDYTKVADGERRYKDSYNDGEGWNPILKAIKKMFFGSGNLSYKLNLNIKPSEQTNGSSYFYLRYVCNGRRQLCSFSKFQQCLYARDQNHQGCH